MALAIEGKTAMEGTHYTWCNALLSSSTRPSHFLFIFFKPQNRRKHSQEQWLQAFGQRTQSVGWKRIATELVVGVGPAIRLAK